MARDINKLKDRLHAVKGLDSASTYNAQDEEEKKKKQAAQLKSDAQINAARQAGEQARLSAIEKNKKILRENREANVQAQKQATAKSNANRAVSPGIEDTISRKQQLTDAMYCLPISGWTENVQAPSWLMKQRNLFRLLITRS